MAGRNRPRTTDPKQSVQRAIDDRRGFVNQTDIIETKRAVQRLDGTGDNPNEIPGNLHVERDILWGGAGGMRWPIDGETQEFAIKGVGEGVEQDYFFFYYEPGATGFYAKNIDTDQTFFSLTSATPGVDAELSMYESYLRMRDLFAAITLEIEAATGNLTTIGDISADGAISAGSFAIAGVPVRLANERWISGAHHDPGATTVSVIGTTAWTLDGTLASNDDANGSRLNCRTTAVSGNVAGVTGPANYRADWGIDASFRASIVDTTNVRVWVAMASNTVSGSDTPSTQAAGFRFSTSAGDTNWMCYTRGSGSGTTTDSGVAVSSGTYVFRMVLDGSSVEFWINGDHVSSHTTNLPTATSLLAPRIRVTTLTTAAKNVGFGVAMIESK